MAAPLPVTAGGILLTERGPTLLVLAVLTIAAAAGGACLAGVVMAINLAVDACVTPAPDRRMVRGVHAGTSSPPAGGDGHR